jgi:hypothetical protein
LLRWGTKRQKQSFSRLIRLFSGGIAALFYQKKTQAEGERAFLRRFRLPTATSLMYRISGSNNFMRYILIFHNPVNPVNPV